MREMRDKDSDDEFRLVREVYNPPPEPPREEMWEAIQARLEPRGSGVGAADGWVVSLDEARERRRVWYRRPAGLAAAAVAILALGIGIGRMGLGPMEGGDGAGVASPRPTDPAVLRTATVQHLKRTESLLTLVRADARSGKLDGGVAGWARTLLTQTRLFMDAVPEDDPVMAGLLNDLELVLVQIVGVAGAGNVDPSLTRSEWDLAMEGLDETEILPRIQAVLPAGPGFVGT